MTEILSHASFWPAVALGIGGGIALVIAEIFTRRGVLMFPVYAAFLASLAVLLAGSDMTFSFRLVSAFAGFIVAAVIQYVGVGIAADRERRRRGFTDKLSLAGHTWRLSLVLTLGLTACIAVALVTA